MSKKQAIEEDVDLSTEEDMSLEEIMSMVEAAESDELIVQQPEPTLESDEIDELELAKAKREAAIAALLEGKGISKDKTAAWKAKYGNIYLFSPEQEVFVYRPLVLKEWEALNIQFSKSDTRQERIQNVVLGSCVLFPKVDVKYFTTARAGLKNALFEVIMQCSYFFTVEQALNYISEI